MANTITIAKDQFVTLTNKSTKHAVRFAPYKESFTYEIPAGESIAIETPTVGQALYYFSKQANPDIETALEKAEGATVVEVASTVTIANSTDKAIAFIPYKENFNYTLEAGDQITFNATTAGQVLYYMLLKSVGLDVQIGA